MEKWRAAVQAAQGQVMVAESASCDATEDDIRAQIEARVTSALDEAMTRAGAEVAEPEGWWNL